MENFLLSMDSNLAEFVGAMLGDGCLSLVHNRSENRIRKVALLTGNLSHDVPYYLERIRPIVECYFCSRGYLGKREKLNCVYLSMGSKIFDFLSNLGFPIGKKNSLEIPHVIMSNKKYARACVRGIFDTDGSLYSRYSKKYNRHPRVYNYINIQFKLKSEKVITQIKSILDSLHIKATKVSKDSIYSVVRVTDQDAITQFMKTIKPSNQYHVERYINRHNVGSPTDL